MKKYIYIMVLSATALLVSSCDDMKDIHMEYVDGGEIIYRAKPDSIVGYSGYNRVKLTWMLKYPAQVTKCQIWENEELLVEMPIVYSDTVYLEQTLTDQKEGIHTYSIYSIDDLGNTSIKSDIIVEVFGDIYANSLRTSRSLQDLLQTVDNVKTLINLSEVTSSKVVGTDITYIDTNGTEKTIRTYREKNQIEILDIGLNSPIILRDLWRPNETVIDVFPAREKVYEPNAIPHLSARLFESVHKLDANTIVATLTKANENIKNSEINYAGKTIVIAADDSQVILNDVPVNAVLSLVTMIEDKEAKVMYKTKVIELQTQTLLTKVAMDSWNVVDFSSQQSEGEGESGGHAAHAIDNKLNTFWHTEYSPSQPRYPHHMTVDMGRVVSVKGISVARRNGNSHFAIQMRLEVSDNNIDWVEVGKFSPDNTIDGLQNFKFETATQGRYFRLTGLVSGTSATYMCVSEINIFE